MVNPLVDAAVRDVFFLIRHPGPFGMVNLSPGQYFLTGHGVLEYRLRMDTNSNLQRLFCLANLSGIPVMH